MVPTTIRLTDEQRQWIEEMTLNVSKYVRSLIDKDMDKWKEISDKVLCPIVNCEQELDESQYHEVQNDHNQIPESAFKEIKIPKRDPLES